MKTFTICSLPEYHKGINLLQKPGLDSDVTILVALVPKMNAAGSILPADPDKLIALIAASVLNSDLTPPELQ